MRKGRKKKKKSWELLGALSCFVRGLAFFFSLAINVGRHQRKKNKKKIRKTLSGIALSVGGEGSVGTAGKCRRGAREAPAGGSPRQGFP